MKICADNLQVRVLSSDERGTGYRLWLLPSGGSAPGDLIEITENANISGQYEFPSSVTNGVYTLYIGEPGSQVPVSHGGTNEQIRVLREGKAGVDDLNFSQSW